MGAFGHFTVGEFGHHDGAVNQHADGEDKAEQNNHVDGQAHHGEDQNTNQERAWDSQADQTGAAQTQGTDDNDHDQDNGADHIVLQIGQHRANIDRLVLHERNLDARRPFGLMQANDVANLLDGVDDVFTEPLFDFQGNRRPTADPGVGVGVLEGPAHAGDVAQGDNTVAANLDG